MPGVRPGALLGHTPGLWTPPKALAGGASITRYRDAVLADSPVAYWRLQESVGPSAADSVGTFTGTYNGAPTLGVASPISDTGAKAVTFNGTTQYINTAAVPTNVTVGYALECWVKLTSLTAASSLFLKNGNGTSGWGVGIGDGAGANGLKLVGLLAGIAWQSSTFTFADTLAHHIVMTRDTASGNTLFYVDGVAAGSATGVGIAPAGDAEIAAEAAARFAAATIAEPAIYAATLSAARAAAHFAAR